jgi:hypothetical protein
MYKIHSTRITVSIIFERAIKLDKILSGIKLIWYYSASEFNSLYTSFSGKKYYLHDNASKFNSF